MHNSPEFHDPEFNDVITGGYADPHPYGIPAQPVKTGLTPRGKAALGIGGAFLACGSLFGWQHYAAQQAEAEQKAQEIALKQQELRLEEIRELNKATAAQMETQAAVDTARQKQIDACVNDNKGLIGKQLGASYRSVVEDCQTQYPATLGSDMQAAATTTGTGDDGGVNPGALLGAGVLGLGLAVAVRKSTKSHPA
ncbi:hypothetical protein [Streptomyces sp. NBRC 110035]|uniref:hypothetical protein n=1 Tax=Streptomyces sp. NBRC 110035 TaxID=1547867 RepID=UPI0005A6C611|nr:hypothetical protein [Streptomyces sp. NBRC 110035]